MPRKPVPTLVQSQNWQIAEAIRKDLGSEYQRRIPEATKASMQGTIEALWSGENAFQRNQFVDALINQFGMFIARGANWSNPLSEFKLQMMPMGATIEEIQVGLVPAYTYDTDRETMERALFGQHRPNVQTSIHKINRENYYVITINEDILRRAFTEEYGLANFVNQLMAAPGNSDQLDEFSCMTSLFGTYERAEGFFKVNVPDVSAVTSTEQQAKALLRSIRSYSETLTFLAPYYNASGMHVAAKKNELVVFCTPDVKAALDVNALAAAFNIDYAAAESRIITIPQTEFRIPGVQAILTTRDFFVVADTLFETRTQPNAAGLTSNHFLHHHQIISVSRFVPAILFWTGEGTPLDENGTPVTSVTPLTVENRTGTVVTEVSRGELYQVFGEAVTTPEGGYNTAVRLELEGATSNFTYLSQTGVLHPGPNEEAETLTITAYAVDDVTKTATASVTVTGDLLVLWPDPSITPDVEGAQARIATTDSETTESKTTTKK